MKEYEAFKFLGVKRMRHEKDIHINEAALEWFKTFHRKKIPISGAVIQHKAKEFANTPSIENFSASNACLDGFRTRNDIPFRLLYGEMAYVDFSSSEGLREPLPLLLAG